MGTQKIKKKKKRADEFLAEGVVLSKLRLYDLAEWEENRRQKIRDGGALSISLPGIGAMQSRVIMEKANEAAMRISALSYQGLQEMNSVSGGILLLWLSLRKTIPDLLESDVEDHVLDVRLGIIKLISISGWEMPEEQQPAETTEDLVDRLAMVTGDYDITPENMLERLAAFAEVMKKKPEAA